jgi:hypothetical protein
MATVIPLPEGWGAACLHEPGRHESRVAGAAHSYDHLGHQLSWRTPDDVEARFACDVESCLRPASDLPTFQNLAPEEFVRRWVATEVLAKLCDVPILAWLKQHGLVSCELGLTELDLSRFGFRAQARLWLQRMDEASRFLSFGFVRGHSPS